jgi:8-amino-7-oxononanoate synthase
MEISTTTQPFGNLDILMKITKNDSPPGDGSSSFFSSLIDMLTTRAKHQPTETAYTFLRDGKNNAVSINYRDLDKRAKAIALTLQQKAQAGDRVMIVVPPGLDFIATFMGCVYANIIAVPGYPPGLTRASINSIRNIADDSGAKLLISTEGWIDEGKFDDILSGSNLKTLYAFEKLESCEGEWIAPDVSGDDIAFLQYTSGTTGDPKGVMISHNNLLSNLETLRVGFKYVPEDTAVFWLPPYHDMGLIGAIFSAVYCNFHAVLMAPATFVRRPLLWLQAITKYKATVTGSPNFGFEMCVRAANKSSKKDLELDLGTLRLAFNGAETVRVNSMAEFNEKFASYGLRKEAITPCYGLAEGTLMCTTQSVTKIIGYNKFDMNELETDHIVDISVKHQQENVNNWREIVSVGKTQAAVHCRIVNPHTLKNCEDNKIGEVWIQGPSVSAGYWQRSEKSAEVFGARIKDEDSGQFLRTGDRGFMSDGELYITSRIKDLIIIRGRNFSAEDIELSVRQVDPSLKPHRCIAGMSEVNNKEILIVSIEFDHKVASCPKGADDHLRFNEIADGIRRSVMQDQGIEVETIIVQKNGHTPITTSGKLRRKLCIERFINKEELPVYASSLSSDTKNIENSNSSQDRQSLTPFSRTELQKKFKIAAEAVFKCPMSISDKFVTLNMDSLKSTELVIAMSDVVGWEIPLDILKPESSIETVVFELVKDSLQTPSFAKNVSVKAIAQEDNSQVNDKTAIDTNGIRHIEKFDEGAPLSKRLELHREHLNGLKRNNALCYGLTQQNSPSNTDISLENQKLTVFSSYSYLGLNHHAEVLQAKHDAVHKYGSGSHAVMLLGGYTDEHKKLEKLLSRNFMCEDTALFSSGYAANLAAIDTLMGTDGIIFCDMLVHTSIMDGCRISGATIQMFPHQNVDALDRMLSRAAPEAPKLVIVDGVYSLRGEIANLPELIEISHRHNALIMVDEAHALGAIGEFGRGTAEYHNVEGQVDIITGGLGKGIPAYGGYVSGRRDIVEFLRFRANTYVYSGGMDVGNVAAAAQAIELMNREPKHMQQMRSNITLMEDLLNKYKIPSLQWDAPCMPVITEDAESASLLAAALKDQGYYVAPITYPAVPKNQQGLRLTVTAAHTHQQIRDFAEVLYHTINQLETKKIA